MWESARPSKDEIFRVFLSPDRCCRSSLDGGGRYFLTILMTFSQAFHFTLFSPSKDYFPPPFWGIAKVRKTCFGLTVLAQAFASPKPKRACFECWPPLDGNYFRWYRLLSILLSAGGGGLIPGKKEVMNHSIIMDFRSEVKCFKSSLSPAVNLFFDHLKETNFRRAIARILLPKKSAQENKFLPPSPAPKLRLEGEETSFFPLPCLYPSAHFVPPPPPPRPTGPTTQLSWPPNPSPIPPHVPVSGIDFGHW